MDPGRLVWSEPLMPQSFGLHLNRVPAGDVRMTVRMGVCAGASWWYWGQAEGASALA
jgi:hypothetical protein